MENLPLISVIVPVYKVEAYLDKCISSIVEQTYTKLEIILVDDGSPDRSGEICDEWALRDSRVRVIHQANAGGGAARNAALDAARGELIAFVDSDDYIAPNMFAHLCGLLMQGTDIAECGYMDVFDNQAAFPCTVTDVQTYTYTVQEAMAEHIRDRSFRQLIWNKLYRRQILDGVRFPEEKGIDDEFFTYRAIGNARILVRTETVLYGYRQQSESVMHTLSIQQRLQAVKAKIERHDYICRYLPQLKALSGSSLWFTCIYQGQLALRETDTVQTKQTLEYLQDVLHKHPVVLTDISIKNKLWLSLARMSMQMTCRLRNLLRIGM